MPIFISYAHSDKKFVEKLALALVKKQIYVWLDKWEIRVGDSLISKIQQALTDASALLVVLSKASIKSQWCTKELNSGLMRELDEKRVVVLPLLVEECEIPLLLREKMYADFRNDFASGLGKVLESLASITNEWQARIEEPKEWHNDMAVDWGNQEGVHWFRFTTISHGEKIPYSILATAMIYTNQMSSRWYQMHLIEGADAEARYEILNGLFNHIRDREDTDVILADQHVATQEVEFEVGPVKMLAVIEIRRLGMDTGGDVYFRIRQQLGGLTQRMHDIVTDSDGARWAFEKEQSATKATSRNKGAAIVKKKPKKPSARPKTKKK